MWRRPGKATQTNPRARANLTQVDKVEAPDANTVVITLKQPFGPFIGICNQRVGTAGEILSQADIVELRDILDYANKFHHDTNPAYETEAINDQELAHFCDRTLRFARRD